MLISRYKDVFALVIRGLRLSYRVHEWAEDFDFLNTSVFECELLEEITICKFDRWHSRIKSRWEFEHHDLERGLINFLDRYVSGHERRNRDETGSLLLTNVQADSLSVAHKDAERLAGM